MPDLVFDDLIMSSGLCPWSPNFALHDLLNLGIEAALMCLDSLRLPRWRVLAQSVLRQTLLHALRWDGLLTLDVDLLDRERSIVESSAHPVLRWLTLKVVVGQTNGAWASTDYGMLELSSDDPVMGSEYISVEPDF
ncbi:hypothetical protein M9H77_19253 [Catharanthus roseus]|uniref:Uncharacterized protein n=1 Tax=Catharanthus roseus TaxID=4058 RepID=A0ACC0B9V2_CATRO|nr:hypothetical protein M9H77_19253 [Catharanthus roseus]